MRSPTLAPQVPRLARLLGLERRTGAAGKDVVDHRDRAHDDLVNVALGAALLATDGSAWEELWKRDAYALRQRAGQVTPEERAYHDRLYGGASADGQPRDAEGYLLNAKGQRHYELNIGRGTGIIRYVDGFR